MASYDVARNVCEGLECVTRHFFRCTLRPRELSLMASHVWRATSVSPYLERHDLAAFIAPLALLGLSSVPIHAEQPRGGLHAHCSTRGRNGHAVRWGMVRYSECEVDLLRMADPHG